MSMCSFPYNSAYSVTLLDTILSMIKAGLNLYAECEVVFRLSRRQKQAGIVELIFLK
jgi:hypothetical protein